MTSITLHDEPDPALREVIIIGLRAYNESRAGATNFLPAMIMLRDDAGEAVGGIAAHTAFGWMFVELLFVPEAMRGEGHGSALMRAAEDLARSRGCTGIWLDTFEFQARPFYERRGYSLFGELKDNPPGYSRYFMQKMIGKPPKGPRRQPVPRK